MKDTYNHFVPVQAVEPILQLVGTTHAAVEVDLAGHNSALILWNVGSKNAGDTLNSTNKFSLKLEHADDSATPGTAGDYANVAAADVLGGDTPASGVVKTVDAEADCDQIYKIGYVGGKRHIKLTLAAAGTIANGTIMSVTVLKGHGQDVPPIS